MRTRNAPTGDYAEWLVARAIGGTLEPNSAKAWDVATPDGERVQAKCRVVGPATSKSPNYSVFRSRNLDRCVFLVLDQSTYDVVRAVFVPMAAVRERAHASAHVNGHRITLGMGLLAMPGAEDVTPTIRAAAQ